MAKKNPKDTLVLIVEDEAALSEAYQLVLEQSGYKVDTAFNGKEALQKVSKTEPDIILLDLRMPVMDGIQFLREYDLTQHQGVKVIVFSNYDMQREIDEAYQLGATRYMLKAWASPRELIQVVESAL